MFINFKHLHTNYLLITKEKHAWYNGRSLQTPYRHYLSVSLFYLEERGLKYMAKPSQYCKSSSDLKIILKNNGGKCDRSLNWVMG